MKTNHSKTAMQVGARLVLPERPLKIKLLGDSITHGCGSASYKEDGEFFMAGVPELAGTRRNTKGYCWAHLFADYMKQVCGCEVVNNAILGTDIFHAVRFFDQLVDDEDDIVFIMYGANNRHEFFTGEQPKYTREEHMRNYLKGIGIVRERLEAMGKDYVFLSGPPDSAVADTCGVVSRYSDTTNIVRHFNMRDINNMLMKDSVENEYPFIPVYAKMVNFFAARGADPRDYREWSEPAGCVHLNEAGSRLAFQMVLDGLGLASMALI